MQSTPNAPPKDDAALLQCVPDYLCITHMLKATPRMEGGQRFIYLEASNEAVDQQDEIVLAKALADSADYFLRYGNLDIDHYTQIGPRMGIPNSASYEIGRPVDVQFSDGKTLVKGLITSGTGAAALHANTFWESLTAISPPQRWYPSVGGTVMGKEVRIDPETKEKRTVITKTRWNNIGFSKTPVNQAVPTVSTVPFGALAKSFVAGGGIDVALYKALTAGYETDSALRTGGAALGRQSLDSHLHRYFEFRDQLARDIRAKKVNLKSSRDITNYAMTAYNLNADVASEWVERFLNNLTIDRKKTV